MKYSHNYSKLDEKIYTTIRRYSKGKIGDIVLEKYPKGQHYAEIIRIVRETINSLPIPVLQKDTDLRFKDEIHALFQSFYKKPIDFDTERFYIYQMKKIFGGNPFEA